MYAIIMLSFAMSKKTPYQIFYKVFYSLMYDAIFKFCSTLLSKGCLSMSKVISSIIHTSTLLQLSLWDKIPQGDKTTAPIKKMWFDWYKTNVKK